MNVSNTNMQPSVVILSSNALRHNFLVNSFAGSFRVVGLVREEKTKEKERASVLQTIVDEHLRERDAAEEKFFSDHRDLVVSSENIFSLARGGANSREVFEWIKERAPDYIVLFGTSIIKDPLLSFYEDRLINMHLGLSPYYRGSGTNFWPLVDGLPECVGATIHLAARAVDAGAILTQTRPMVVSENDSCHSIGCKTIIAGTESYTQALSFYHAGMLTPSPQDLTGGKIFLRKDFSSDAVQKMRKNFAAGMMKDYLKNKEERDIRYPIIAMKQTYASRH